MNELLTVKDTAKLLNLHEVSVRRLINRGKLNYQKIGGRLFIKASSLGINNNNQIILPTYGELLKRGKSKIGVWGVGYIGFSTLVYYAVEGIEGIGYDIDNRRIVRVNRGEVDIPGLDEWLNVPIKHLIAHNLLKATNSSKELLDSRPLVNFICIPTEKNGDPWLTPLVDVIRKIAEYIKKHPDYKPLLIVESTLTPGASDKIVIPIFEKLKLKVGVDLLYAIAPRRDWFVDSDKTLKNLDRVFGGIDNESGLQTESVLSIVCDKLHQAANHRIAEMVKSVENAYRHMDITLANQLTLAYPHDSIRDMLQLVATKWNIGLFQPSFGTGGYCIPLSSKYVISGADRPDELTLLKATIKTDQNMPKRVALSLIKHNVQSVGILGISYKGNLKVPHQSPAIGIARELIKKGIRVKVNDPYYEDKEIKSLTGCQTFTFPDDLTKFDALVIVADHDAYNMPNVRKFIEKSKIKVIYDNIGFWKNLTIFNEKGIAYYIPGNNNWLK